MNEVSILWLAGMSLALGACSSSESGESTASGASGAGGVPSAAAGTGGASEGGSGGAPSGGSAGTSVPPTAGAAGAPASGAGSPGTAGAAGTPGSAGAGGAVAGTSFETLPGPNGSQFVPIWRDEFDGPDVDTSKWHVLEMFPDMDLPWRRNWKASNVSIVDGALVIQTIRENDGSFSTGAVRTGDYSAGPWLFGQAFGRFEARMMRPTQQGHWAAFWLFTPEVGNVDQSGRDGTEIDIAEFARPQRDEVHHALHWDGYDADHQSTGQDATGFGVDDGGWHTVALEWTPDEYVFFVDGTETWRTTDGGVCQVPVYIKFTEEIGNYGTDEWAWGGGPIEDATLPDTFRIDYVRVWQYQPAP